MLDRIDELDTLLRQSNPSYDRGYEAGFQAGIKHTMKQVKIILNGEMSREDLRNPELIGLADVVKTMLDAAYEEGYQDGSW